MRTKSTIVHHFLKPYSTTIIKKVIYEELNNKLFPILELLAYIINFAMHYENPLNTLINESLNKNEKSVNSLFQFFLNRCINENIYRFIYHKFQFCIKTQ